MKIHDLRTSASAGIVRASATVTWEESERAPMEVFFETTEEAGSGLRCNPDAFLVAAFLPAWRHGERRLKIDAPVCPELVQGVETAMEVIGTWYQRPRPRMRIEATPRAAQVEGPPPRAAFFFSGGVDSLATLRTNHLAYPRGHAGRIRDGFLVFGLEVDRPESFDHAVASLRHIAEDAQIALIPVRTNVRYLDDDWVFWADEFQDAVLASVAHAFSGQVTVASIASSDDPPNLHPCGSHPILDPCYSSFEVRIRQDGLGMTRLDKATVLADWEVALKHLRVCNDSTRYRAGVINCGECEKCVRTMLAFEALGVLERASAFADRSLTAALVRRAAYMQEDTYYYYPELLEPLRRRGRHDLAAAVEDGLRLTHGEVGWRAPIKRVDREYFSGHLIRGVKKLWQAGTRSSRTAVTLDGSQSW